MVHVLLLALLVPTVKVLVWMKVQIPIIAAAAVLFAMVAAAVAAHVRVILAPVGITLLVVVFVRIYRQTVITAVSAARFAFMDSAIMVHVMIAQVERTTVPVMECLVRIYRQIPAIVEAVTKFVPLAMSAIKVHVCRLALLVAPPIVIVLVRI